MSLSGVGGNLWLRAHCCWDALMLICCSRGALLCTHTCCTARRAREAVGVVVDSLLFVVAHAADVFLCEALYFTVEPWVLMISPVWLGAPPRQTADCRRLPRCLYSGGRWWGLMPALLSSATPFFPSRLWTWVTFSVLMEFPSKVHSVDPYSAPLTGQ